MRRRGLVSNLYRTARLANDVSALASGNPHRIARRARNKIVGQALARGGLRLLWRRRPAEGAPMRLLILSGLPGAGKTTYACWLERRGWGRLSVDHSDQAPALATAWWRAVGGDDTQLYAIARSYTGVVIEWGFSPARLSEVKAMIDSGYDAWYFDGDHQAALASWKTAWPDMPEGLWRGQVTGLDLRSVERSVIAELLYIGQAGGRDGAVEIRERVGRTSVGGQVNRSTEALVIPGGGDFLEFQRRIGDRDQGS